MRLSDALFTIKDVRIFRVTSGLDERLESDFTDWQLEALDIPLLSARFMPHGRLDGLFTLKGWVVPERGTREEAYVNMTILGDSEGAARDREKADKLDKRA
jgi:hypothetical protein